MSNDKLQASDIAGFVPHGVKFRYDNDFVSPQIRTAEFSTVEFLMNNGKPNLFNPSVLTQTITFRGKQVCHLIELAKIAFPNIKGWFIEDDIVIPIGFNFSFSYNEEKKSFESFDYDFEKDEKIPFTTPNQVALFAYLNWALVDYMGLGKLCEYVDLENNNVYAK